MTYIPAGQPETATAVLFGTTTEPPSVTAERTLGPHLRASLGVLAHLPETVRKAAIGAVIAATIALLDFNIIELLVDGWREYHDLTDAARHTLAKPGSTELVALATHEITASQQPSIDIVINGERVATLEFELTLVFDISAAVVGVSAGMMTAVHSGRCDITATLAIQGAEALNKQKRIELPGVLALEHGIRLLHERDYAIATQSAVGTGGESAAARARAAETVRIAAIRNDEESTAT